MCLAFDLKVLIDFDVARFTDWHCMLKTGLVGLDEQTVSQPGAVSHPAMLIRYSRISYTEEDPVDFDDFPVA